jgi:hypothetical protein
VNETHETFVQNILQRNLKRRDLLGKIGVYGRIIFKNGTLDVYWIYLTNDKFQWRSCEN